jgi:serine/threonine-protein phosphatase 6 regulatory ankyrin repeat subunit C
MGWTDLHEAALAGGAERVKELLKKGADPNTQDKKGRTPLHWAAYIGHFDVVELLLKHGADPNIKINTAIRRCTRRRIGAVSTL